MGEPDIRISLKDFCPQMTLPCVKKKAYPDPFSCRHYYYCDDHGEVRRYTCGTDDTKMVSIVQGAALCVRKRKSTCDSLRPIRQCDTLSSSLPREYCEVQGPARTSWTYPDPEHCQGFYRFTPPDLTVNDRHALVVERLNCTPGTYYSPHDMDCSAAEIGGSCGGKWIRENDECVIIKSSGVASSPQHRTTINTIHGASKMTGWLINGTTVTALPHIVPFNAVSILNWVVGLASALVLLTILITLGIVIYQRRRQKRQSQNASYNLNETDEVNGMGISRPLSFAELNEYAAINEVFANSLDRSRLTQIMNERACVNENVRESPTCSRSVPDGYGASEAPTLPPRPKLQSHSSSDSKKNQLDTSAKSCYNPDHPPLVGNAFCKTCSCEQKKGFHNINWQTALNSTIPEDSYSSDEYEAISVLPQNLTPPTCNNSHPEGSVKPQSYTLKEFEENPALDNQDYMIPVVALGNREIRETTSLVVPLRIGRRTHSLPHKSIVRHLSFADSCEPLASPSPISEVGETVKNLRHAISKTKRAEDKDSDHGPATFDYPETEAMQSKDMEMQFSIQIENNQDWNVSDSWTRCGSAIGSIALEENLGAEENKSTVAVIPLETTVVDDRKSSITSLDTSVETSIDLPTSPEEIFPDIALAEQVGEIREPSAVSGAKCHIMEDAIPENQQRQSYPSEDAQTENKAEQTEQRRLGYEILVTTSSPTDFRVYQYISAESSSTSSSEDDLQSIPEMDFSVLTPEGSVKNHEYYVLDKHHSSDNAVDGSFKATNVAVFESKKRQSCNF